MEIETQKIMNGIHNNWLKKRQEIEAKEKQQEVARKKKEEKEKRQERFWLISLVFAMIVILVLYGIWNNKQVKDCMEKGHSETFCRYAGE